MILKQYYLACLSHASYLIADESTKTAVVVDPQRDIEQYVADAAARGLSIRHVFLTHFHADFVAGHLELAAKTGATIRLGARARADYAFTPMSDGQDLEFGSVRMRVLETPGHTPEGVSLLVFDLAKDREKPQAVLTGDTLFIGDVGRPDLMASVGMTASDLAGMMYDSLHGKLMKLPDETLVYPAHGAGSSCGKNLSKDTVSTIGAQRASNYMLRPMSREAFVAQATQGLATAPRYFGYDAQLNKEQRDTLEVLAEPEIVEKLRGRCSRSRSSSCSRTSARAGWFSTRATPTSSQRDTSRAASASACGASTPTGPARCSTRSRVWRW